MSARLVCDSCDATPERGYGAGGIDAIEGYLEGSDCPACDEGTLYVPDGFDDEDEYDDEDEDPWYDDPDDAESDDYLDDEDDE